MTDNEFLDRLERMRDVIPKYAKAKAERIYIEQFRKAKIAMLMRDTYALTLKTSAEREAYAYSHKDYLTLLTGLKEATEIEEKHKWTLENLKIEVDVWRSSEASRRALESKI